MKKAHVSERIFANMYECLLTYTTHLDRTRRSYSAQIERSDRDLMCIGRKLNFEKTNRMVLRSLPMKWQIEMVRSHHNWHEFPQNIIYLFHGT